MAKILMMENKIYWKEAVKILKAVSNSSDNLIISENMKMNIHQKILESIKQQNYLVTKLLIFSRITKEILLNFLFYNAVNKENTYNLYLNFPSRYCNTYMFHILPDNLPNLRQIFSPSDLEYLSEELKINDLLNEISQCNLEQLKTLFRGAFLFSNSNPYSREIY